MIDGTPYKMLRPHLSTHNLTPEEYRERNGLRPDYPTVSESYSQVRRGMVKKNGLGRKPGDEVGPRRAKSPSSTGRKAKAG